MPLYLSQALVVIFASLLALTFYLMMKMFTYIDPAQFQRFRLLGLFALLFPGVLKPGGAKVFLFMVISALCMFVTGFYLFEFGEFFSGP